MYAIGANGESYIHARVDKQSSFPPVTLGVLRPDDLHGFARQRLQFACQQVFFPKLDVIDTTPCSFGDLVEKAGSARELVAGKGGAIGNVVKNTCGHQFPSPL